MFANDPNPVSPNATKAFDSNTELELLRDQVRRLSGMALLGELTGTATHEFNNVLMTIINYAKLGLRNQDAASRDKALNKILESSQRAAQIAKTILAQARNRGDAMEPTDLTKLIDDTLVLMQRELQKYRVAVELVYGESVPMISASGNELQRLLLNLMTNARQAMPQGGTLWIQVIQSSTPDGQPLVEMTLRDSGSGISPDVLPRIFDPFFSTKSGPDESGKGGTGLGLAACKEVIDAHAGRIRVESTLGRGTAFIISFPADRSQQAAA